MTPRQALEYLREKLRDTHYIPVDVIKHGHGYTVLLINVEAYTVDTYRLRDICVDSLDRLISRLRNRYK